MILQKYTRVFNTEHRPVETGVIFPDEGMASVFVKEGNKTVVRPSTGAAGEKFAGLSLSRNAPPLFMPLVLDTTVTEEVIELPRTPMAGQILVRIGGTAQTIVASETAPETEGNEVSLDDNFIRLHPSALGKPLFIQMMYEPTVTEARTYQGDAPVGGLPTTGRGIIGLITKGDIATSYYDASVDWSGALNVKLGPDGLFTTEGPGTSPSNVTVVEAPTAANPTLIINIQ